MRIWAFGTSPHGLGLSEDDLWALTPWQYRSLKEVADLGRKEAATMYYQIRADIHNSSELMQRTDKQRWTAQDFGADAPPEIAPQQQTPEEARAAMEWKAMQVACAMASGAGKGPRDYRGLSIVAAMKADGAGQRFG